MFESSINVKLKSIFDKLYLSRNLFDKMKDLISNVEVGSHSYEQLLIRANNILNIVNDVSSNIEGLVEYNNFITLMKNKNDTYIEQCDNLVLEMLNYYENVITELITDVETARELTSERDLEYVDLPNVQFLNYNPQFLSGKMANYIPTDDVFAWNSVTKGEEIAANKLFISVKSVKNFDPLEESSPTYVGNNKSSLLSHTPTIYDVVTNVKGGGFSLDSINSKTGERYTRICDDYNADISVDTNKNFKTTLKTTDSNGNILSYQQQSLNLKIEEIKPLEVLIRRHCELELNSVTKIYANIHEGTFKEGLI